MKASSVLLIVAITIVVTLATVGFVEHHAPRSESVLPPASTETAYERVMRTGTLRCGYALYPIFFERDPNTNALSGVYYDFVEEIGKQLSLKIEWTEEVALANAFDGLKSRRYDVMCFPFNQTPGRARATEFTIPIIYVPFYAYVRADDTRFDRNYEKINDPSIKFAYLEGEFSQYLKAEKFPKAQSVSMPNLTDVSQVLLQVALGKADITTTAPSTAEAFLAHNPGKLRRVVGAYLRMQNSGGLSVAVGEESLKNMLDTTLRAMLASGVVEKIIGKYTTSPDLFFYPVQPWGASAQPAGGFQ